MLKILTEHIGNMVIVECDGQIASAQAARRLGEAVTSEIDAEAVVLDLTEVDGLTRRVVRMFSFLQRWAKAHDIELKVFGPSESIRDQLRQANFEIAGLHEMIVLLARAKEWQEKYVAAWAA